MVEIHCVWLSVDTDNNKITLFGRPRVSIHVDEQIVERYGTPEQLAEYRRKETLFRIPGEQSAPMDGNTDFLFFHAGYVDHDWAASRTVEELDEVVGNHVRAQKQYDALTDEDETCYRLYLQEQDMEKRTYRAWCLIANPRNLPKEIVNQETEFRFKLFPEKRRKNYEQ